MLLEICQIAFLLTIQSVECSHDLHTSLVQLKQLWLNEIDAVRMLEKVLYQIISTQSAIKELVVSASFRHFKTNNIKNCYKIASQISSRFQEIESTTAAKRRFP